MACGVHLGFLLVCLIHAASVSCLLGTQAKLFPRQDGGAGGLQGAPQPQNQLRQVVRPVGADGPSRTGGGYRRALPQVPQNGRPLKPVVQSRPSPPPSGFSWQAGMYPSTRTGQNPADPSRRASPQTPRKRPSSPMTSSALFIDGEYVQMQTSAKGRGRKVSASDAAKPQRFMSTQGRWLQGRYKSISGDSESPQDLNSGASRNSKFFKSTNTVPAPSGGKRAQNPGAPRKRPSGNPSVQYAPTRVLEIPDHLGGFAIRRLTKPGKRKPQQAVHLQERLSPRMHRGGRPGSSLTKWN
ncbi:translation initiation factor IF-2-like isoform X2 [Takifugu flavidus]|uniref:Uncharacterized protein n=1 Tax=Takifugu flavidus TaxID=433684 RepID=A0A5C6NFT5_9TELE|nr:translation initiation factor IF-2-like isoform X2 [Takifugu flavidus]TWW65461.1 hypothetical protein D4764_21G0003610 [Takifugu flavidus]